MSRILLTIGKVFNPKAKGSMSQVYNDVYLSSAYNEPTWNQSVPERGIDQVVMMNQKERNLIMMDIFGYNELEVSSYGEEFFREELD